VQSVYDFPAPVSIEGRQESAEAIDVASRGTGVTELICWQRLRIVHDRHLLTQLRNIEGEFGNDGTGVWERGKLLLMRIFIP
jgi:hypothetical protein